MIFHEKNFEEKNLVPWDPLRVPRVPILGPARGIFSKLNGPGPLRSGGHSHTSFSTGEFLAAQRTLGSDVNCKVMKSIFDLVFHRTSIGNGRIMIQYICM